MMELSRTVPPALSTARDRRKQRAEPASATSASGSNRSRPSASTPPAAPGRHRSARDLGVPGRLRRRPERPGPQPCARPGQERPGALARPGCSDAHLRRRWHCRPMTAASPGPKSESGTPSSSSNRTPGRPGCGLHSSRFIPFSSAAAVWSRPSPRPYASSTVCPRSRTASWSTRTRRSGTRPSTRASPRRERASPDTRSATSALPLPTPEAMNGRLFPGDGEIDLVPLTAGRPPGRVHRRMRGRDLQRRHLAATAGGHREPNGGQLHPARRPAARRGGGSRGMNLTVTTIDPNSCLTLDDFVLTP